MLKNLPAHARDVGLVPEGPLKKEWHLSLVFLPGRVPMDRGAWQAAVHGAAKSQIRLSD